MLQQILQNMYIDPEILEELSDDQKQILFFKMREEQIRRWKVREDRLAEEDKLKPRMPKASSKNVHFYCDGDSNLIIDYIDKADQIDIEDVKKKQEEEARRKAGEQARKEAAQKRKELDEIEAKRKEELRRKEEERLKKEKEEKEAELKRKAEEESIYQTLKAARLQKEKEEAENKLLEEQRRKEEEQRLKEEEQRRKEEEQRQKEEEQRRKEEEQQKKAEEMRLQEIARKKREELEEEERKRKEEIYQSMKLEQEEKQKWEEEEATRLEKEWEERETKAKIADEKRRCSISNTKNEFERIRKLAKEKAELEKFRKTEVSSETSNIETTSLEISTTSTLPTSVPVTKIANLPQSKGRSLPKKPQIPVRPVISNPVNVTSSRDEVDTILVRKEVIKPTRPPPAPSQGSPNNSRDSTEKNEVRMKVSKPIRPTRPKCRKEVLTWWKDSEYEKLSGLDKDKKPLEWFHGIITRYQAEKILANKKQGSYLVRVSERVWGYTISFKDIGRCKHFLVDTINDGYQFFGMEQIVHKSLNELVEFHKKNPISGLGQEVLLYPCGQERSKPDYEDLFVDNTPI